GRAGLPGATTSRASTSASTRCAPHSTKRRETVLLPVAIPPVSPTCSMAKLHLDYSRLLLLQPWIRLCNGRSRRSVGQRTPRVRLPPSRTPSARFAWRLHGFVTNHHEQPRLAHCIVAAKVGTIRAP